MKKIGLIAGVAFALSLVVSCSVPTAPVNSAAPSWENFYGQSVKELVVDGETQYLIEGDVIATSMQEVEQYYDLIAEAASVPAESRSSVMLIRKNGKYVYDTYSTTVRLNLTYKIDATIPLAVRTELETALGAWETYAGVDFKNITGTSATPVFTLRNATASEEAAAPGVIASAFFPSYAKKELKLYADFYELFSNGATFYGWDMRAVLIHELGHGIGLRHEFIWTKSGLSWKQTGETSSPAKLLSSARDDYSIMFYPQYAAYVGNGRLSTLDVDGVKLLYPKN